jgi:hypothetical protein
MDAPTTAQQRKRRVMAAGFALVCVFGLVAFYQITPVPDRSGELLPEPAATSARREGERVGADDGRNSMPEPASRFEKLATDSAEASRFRGLRREEWRKEFMTGYIDGYMRERAIQRRQVKEAPK